MDERIVPPAPHVRIMRPDDLPAVIEIDGKVFGQRRPEYYERKTALSSGERQRVVVSLVTEVEGKVVGFIMGEVYLGEFGVPESMATIDTIGVDPAFQGRGVGSMLFDEYVSHVSKIGVQSISTRVSWNHWNLLRFFDRVGFAPAKVVQLEMRLA